MEGLGINLPVLVAQIVNFVILFGLLYLVAYKPITRMLDERSWLGDTGEGAGQNQL